LAIDEKQKEPPLPPLTHLKFSLGHTDPKCKNENLKETVRLLDRLNVIPLDFSSAKRAAEISAKLGAIGEPIDYRDTMIVAMPSKTT